MKKSVIMISVAFLLLAGCGSEEDITSVSVIESVVMEAEETDTEAVQIEETKLEEETTSLEMENDISEEQVLEQTEEKEIKVDEVKAESSVKEEPGVEETAKMIDYSPQKVVSLATSKTKAYGKILLTDNLDNLLASGDITKEEYDAYYPYDGAGYYSVFVETDLSTASTTSGRKLTSEDAIAQYIADMLAIESGPYFLIEYAGTYSKGGTEFYEFRCYRA